MGGGSPWWFSLGCWDPALPAGCVIGLSGRSSVCPSGKRRNEGDRWPSIPNYMTRRVPVAPSLGYRGPLCFVFDDKLFCCRIMVNVIMSIDGEPENDFLRVKL